jgi:hypothetical protein
MVGPEVDWLFPYPLITRRLRLSDHHGSLRARYRLYSFPTPSAAAEYIASALQAVLIPDTLGCG